MDFMKKLYKFLLHPHETFEDHYPEVSSNISTNISTNTNIEDHNHANPNIDAIEYLIQSNSEQRREIFILKETLKKTRSANLTLQEKNKKLTVRNSYLEQELGLLLSGSSVGSHGSVAGSAEGSRGYVSEARSGRSGSGRSLECLKIST